MVGTIGLLPRQSLLRPSRVRSIARSCVLRYTTFAPHETLRFGSQTRSPIPGPHLYNPNAPHHARLALTTHLTPQRFRWVRPFALLTDTLPRAAPHHRSPSFSLSSLAPVSQKLDLPQHAGSRRFGRCGGPGRSHVFNTNLRPSRGRGPHARTTPQQAPPNGAGDDRLDEATAEAKYLDDAVTLARGIILRKREAEAKKRKEKRDD